jgi:hypothetical protein
MRRSCRFAGAGPWISAPACRSGAHRSAVVRGRDTSGSAAPRRLFAAGVITRQLLTARELPAVESKLTAVAKMAPFLALFLIVRGAAALSTLVFPLLGLRIKGASAAEPIATGAST